MSLWKRNQLAILQKITPTHYDSLLNSSDIDDNTDLSFIKMVGLGGDGLREAQEIKLNRFFAKHNCPNAAIKGYGMTEVSAAASANRPENNVIGSVGLPFVNTIISTFEIGTDRELKYGEKGEICIFSPSTMIGYYNNADETNRILRKHSDGRVWVHSGDIGYVTEDGNVFIEGRIKRMIIRYDGFKVFPIQIEKVVDSCEGIDCSCVVGIDDSEHSSGKLPVVFVVKSKTTQKSNYEIITELNEACMTKLPEYAIPNSFRFIESLPLTPIGKVDYRSLEIIAEE